MANVSFDDASILFEYATTWVNKHEVFWYQRAWKALERQVKTVYHSQKEYYQVLLYALSIIKSYDDFCAEAFEMPDNFFYLDLLDDVIPELVLGQFISLYAQPDELFESVETGLFCILNDLKYEVFRAIKREMSEAEVFAWMYCTGFTPIDPNASDDDDLFSNPHYVLDCYEDYAAMIDKEIEWIVNSDMTFQKMQAFDYVYGLMAQ